MYTLKLVHVDREYFVSYDSLQDAMRDISFLGAVYVEDEWGNKIWIDEEQYIED